MKKLLLVVALAPTLAAGHSSLTEEVAQASTSYEGYIRCEDIKVKDLVALRASSGVSVKASTTLGSTTVVRRARISAEETAKTATIAFGVPATKTQAVMLEGPTTAGFEVGIERVSKDSAILDVAVCIGHMRLSPDGDEQKSETVGKGSLLADDTSQVLWKYKGALAQGHVYVLLVQPRSLATSTQYRVAVQRRSS